MLKRQLKEEKARVAEEMVKRNDAKRAAKSELRAEQFLTSEEAMLRRFKKALEKSGQTSGAKKAERKKREPKPSFFAPVVNENEPIPEYVEYDE